MTKKQNCVLCTDSLIVHLKTNDIYKDVVEENERRFDTSSYGLEMGSLKEDYEELSKQY